MCENIERCMREMRDRVSGIFFVLPCIESYTKVDLRTVSFDVPPQEVSLVSKQQETRGCNDYMLRVTVCAGFDERQCDGVGGCCGVLSREQRDSIGGECGERTPLDASSRADDTSQCSRDEEPG